MITSSVLADFLSISPDGSRNPRAAIGLFLREKAIHNPMAGVHWTASVLFGLVQELVSFWDAEGEIIDGKNSLAVTI